MLKNIMLLMIVATCMSANAYVAGPGVQGQLVTLVDAKLVCMDVNTRKVWTISEKIGPSHYLGVVGNVDTFTILSVDYLKHVVSIRSDEIDREKNSLCRIDIGERDFSSTTRLTGLQKK